MFFFIQSQRKAEISKIPCETIELYGFYLVSSVEKCYRIIFKGLECVEQNGEEHNLLGKKFSFINLLYIKIPFNLVNLIRYFK